MQPTIRKGDTDKRFAPAKPVSDWQSYLVAKGFGPLTVDGAFGDLTDKATRRWQSSQKLVPDGVVGAVSWAVSEGKSVPAVKTSMAPTDLKAYEIAKRAMPELTEAERQYALTVARGEGGYGLGWAHPSPKTIEDSQKFGLTGYEGTDSNNWGADQGKGSAGSFPHVDYHADGTVYVGQYAKQKTPEEGFARMARIILNGGKRGAEGAKEIRAAINAGDLPAAVAAQHRNGYFELAPEKYLAEVMRNYATLTANIGWRNLFNAAGSALSGIGGPGLAIAGGLVLGGLLWWARSKG